MYPFEIYASYLSPTIEKKSIGSHSNTGRIKPIYIGIGKRGRHQHVGVNSHNVVIRFLCESGYQLKTTVLAYIRTKEVALLIEKLLINSIEPVANVKCKDISIEEFEKTYQDFMKVTDTEQFSYGWDHDCVIWAFRHLLSREDHVENFNMDVFNRYSNFIQPCIKGVLWYQLK